MLSIVDSIEAKNRRICEIMSYISEKEKAMKTDQAYLYEVVKKSSNKGGQMDVDEQSSGFGYVN